MSRMDFKDDAQLVLKTAKQIASSLVKTIVAAHGLNNTQKYDLRHHEATIHFHDDSTNQIAWNDVQAIIMHNELTGEDLSVPLMASEGYNQHGHTGPYDGGWIPGMGIHDHRDNVSGAGFAFAVYHPGTGLPQQPWAL
jgi:hypothetical protein